MLLLIRLILFVQIIIIWFHHHTQHLDNPQVMCCIDTFMCAVNMTDRLCSVEYGCFRVRVRCVAHQILTYHTSLNQRFQSSLIHSLSPFIYSSQINADTDLLLLLFCYYYYSFCIFVLLLLLTTAVISTLYFSSISVL